MNSEPEWPPVKSNAEINEITFRVVRCLDGLNLQEAHHVLRNEAPWLLNSAHVVNPELIDRIEAAQKLEQLSAESSRAAGP